MTNVINYNDTYNNNLYNLFINYILIYILNINKDTISLINDYI